MPRLTKKISKLAFTLVEMLIVIVIIGILAAAIIPKITGVMSRARDTKRIADLSNVQMAIEQYRMDNGQYPTRLKNGTWMEDGRGGLLRVKFSPNDFRKTIGQYISTLPTDPQKNNMIKIHYQFVNQVGSPGWEWLFDDHKDGKGGTALEPGQYLYQIFQKNGDPYGAAVLVAKVETPGSANYILTTKEHTLNGGTWLTNYGMKETTSLRGFKHNGLYYAGGAEDIDKLHLCSSVKKVSKGQEKPATENNTECKYSSEEQLYYIIKV